MSELGPTLHALEVIAVAALLAGVLGFERELARRPAGLRTHVLVGVAAALFMLVGEGVLERFAADQGRGIISTDPIRVIQAIVVGISFLGAGTIVHQGNARIEGLTTAASILLTAAIAIAVAIDQKLLAALVTAGVVAVLAGLGKVEQRLGSADPPPADEPAGDPDCGRAPVAKGSRRGPPAEGE